MFIFVMLAVDALLIYQNGLVLGGIMFAVAFPFMVAAKYLIGWMFQD